MTSSLTSFRPTCSNKDRLLLWLPSNSTQTLLPSQINTRKKLVILYSIQKSTRTTYGTGLA